PPRCPLFPCTTLFRSLISSRLSRTVFSYRLSAAKVLASSLLICFLTRPRSNAAQLKEGKMLQVKDSALPKLEKSVAEKPMEPPRSEEHTSELQSRENL